MSHKVKYIDKNYLNIFNHVSDKVLKFNRTLPQEVIDRLPEDKFFPIVFTMWHEHKAGVKCDPHVRCIIAVPNNSTDKMDQLVLDVDASLFDVLPEIDVPDRAEQEVGAN